ncbi:MAG: YceD family protein [Thiogranum sp.]|nr:YceD family protein [Thiogranum sp.]
MLDCLPKRIEPVGLADAGRSFRGKVPIAELQRLAPALYSSEGELDVRLEFGLNERCIRTVTGSIEGSLDLVCQRCLGSLRFPLALRIRLGVISDETQIRGLPEGFEPLLATGEPLATFDLIEDEVLLAIPAIPRHTEDEHCETGYENQPLPGKDNPFTVLGKLKS